MQGLYQGSLLEETISATMDEIRIKAHGPSTSRTQDSGLFHGPPRGSLTLVTLRDALVCRNQEKARGEKELWIRTPKH